MWAGTLQSDGTEPSGWRRSLWAAGPGGRGWQVATLHVGDVVEFGSCGDPDMQWFGWQVGVALSKVLAGFRMFLDDLPEERRLWLAESDESLRQIGF